MSSRAQARIDVGAIERNARRLLGRTGPATRLCAVVKADGYGHGAVAVARAAVAGGATWLAVATADEASALRGAGMDSLAVDLGSVTDAAVGDEVVLIGARGDDRILAEDLARTQNTINYEIVCALGPRVERSYAVGVSA